MSLTQAQKTQFLDAYTKVLVAAWSDEQRAAALEQDPKAALVAAGLDLPESTQVRVVRIVAPSSAARASDAELEIQVSAYERSLETGDLELYIPSAPAIEGGALNETDLEEVQAGFDTNSLHLCAYCCCCCCA